MRRNEADEAKKNPYQILNARESGPTARRHKRTLRVFVSLPWSCSYVPRPPHRISLNSLMRQSMRMPAMPPGIGGSARSTAHVSDGQTPACVACRVRERQTERTRRLSGPISVQRLVDECMRLGRCAHIQSRTAMSGKIRLDEVADVVSVANITCRRCVPLVFPIVDMRTTPTDVGPAKCVTRTVV